MSRDTGILGRQISPRSSDSPKSSIRHSSNGSNASLPTIVEVPEDVDTRGDPYVPAGFRGVWKSSYCARIAAVAAVGGFALGYNQGLLTFARFNNRFISQFPQMENKFWYDLAVAMTKLGGFLGAFITGSFANHFAGKRSMSIAGIILILGFTVQVVSMNYAMLVVARFISGVAIGMFSVITPIYISEISPAEIRGSLLVFSKSLHFSKRSDGQQLSCRRGRLGTFLGAAGQADEVHFIVDIAVIMGLMASFWISFAARYIHGEESWRLPFVLLVIPALVLGVAGIFLPYSPRWLALRFENQQVLCILGNLRRLGPDNCKVQNEWMEMRVEAAYQREITETQHPLVRQSSHRSSVKLDFALWLDCFRSRYWKRSAIAIGMMLFQQFFGVNALVYNIPSLLRTLGVASEMQLSMRGILMAVHLLGAISCLWTTDIVGRKRLLALGSTLMLFCLIVIAGLNSKFSYDWSAHRGALWICIGHSIVCTFAFGASWSTISWILPSELFPSTLRAKGSALSSCSYFLNDFLVGIIVQILLHKSQWGAFGFFALFCLFSGFWVQLLPETKDTSLEDMDKLFGCNEEQKKENIRKSLAIGYSPEPFTSPGGTPRNGIRFV